MKYMVSADKSKCGSTTTETKETSTELLKSASRKYNQMVAVRVLFITHKTQGYFGNTAIRAVL
jgi:hypothetical protein